MNNSDLFLTKYKELETIIKEKYDQSIEEYVESSNIKFIKDNSYFLDTIRRLRNILSHYKDETPLVDVSIDTINKLENIKKYIVSPPKAKDFYIPLSKIVYGKDEDLILPLYKIMQEKGFSHIPILNKQNKVVGVFDGNVMTSSLLLNKEFKIEDHIKFSDKYIKPFTLINNQYFNTYIFISENTNIIDIKEIFKKYKKNTKKISMLFVTRNGKEDEPLLGLITPNDILSNF